MALGKEEFGTLRLEAAVEEVGAKLKDIFGLLCEDFAVESLGFVFVGDRERHGGVKVRWGWRKSKWSLAGLGSVTQVRYGRYGKFGKIAWSDGKDRVITE